MTIVTGYTSLLTAVASYLDRNELTASLPNFVQNFEERFYRNPKNFGRWMEASTGSTITNEVVAVPSDYLALKYSYINANPGSRLDRVSINQLYGTYPRNGMTGMPVWVSRDAGNFVFGPVPDQEYTFSYIYFAKPVVLRSYASDAAAHWLIVNAPDLCLYGSLLEAAPFLRNDERVPLWNAAFELAIDGYRDMQRDEDFSGSPIQEVLG